MPGGRLSRFAGVEFSFSMWSWGGVCPGVAGGWGLRGDWGWAVLMSW